MQTQGIHREFHFNLGVATLISQPQMKDILVKYHPHKHGKDWLKMK